MCVCTYADLHVRILVTPVHPHHQGIRITLLGHQKRFLHCIAQLKGVHPEWVEQEVDNRKVIILML